MIDCDIIAPSVFRNVMKMRILNRIFLMLHAKAMIMSGVLENILL